MKIKWYKKVVGARTIKTGLATFLTALFCLSLNLNPIFAILSAVVTIEPTVKASIHKGYKRLPATVMGAFIAVVSAYFFGDDSAITYGLTATLTIILCIRFNLHPGILVATLTALAMIPDIHDNYLFNIFSRLLTAIIGLVTAGLVNFMVLPPKYYEQIEELIESSERQIYFLFDERMKELLIGHFQSEKSDVLVDKLHTCNTRIEELLGYQRDELKYHKTKNRSDDWMRLRKLTNRAHENRLLLTHLSNIIYLPQDAMMIFTDKEKEAIISISQRVDQIFQCGTFKPERKAASTLKNSVKGLNEFDTNQIKSHTIYEILLIYRILLLRYRVK
ncbi:FUSC family protein [Staphylococcus americanisciuri]|uniref:Aromatic acid exporter family protein n=1 Tax=Staphylococcus americanisciuri TaxID=2973940 RepID=A0ABT2F665_9STAP|nr:aromatic acid exporter family protein [Staphylococcus americanisciuri]MCS4487302.1 aromatic acid exporter family protein [Staphylococcus americanisciuri]